VAWIELSERRNKKEKHYYDSDTNKFQAVLTVHDQHYHDGSLWQDVDERFEDETGEFGHQNTRTRHHIHIGVDSRKRWMPRRDHLDEYVHFGRLQYWNGTIWVDLNLGTPVRAQNKITWDTVNFTLTLTNTWRNIKMDVVLKNSTAARPLRWAVSLNGLTWDNWTLVSNSDGLVVGTIERPVAWDANGSRENPNIIITPSYSGGYVDFRGDLSSAVYPVIIDPTFTDGYGGDVDTAYDALLTSTQPDVNWGSDGALGYRGTEADSLFDSVILFTLTDLVGKTITSANLHIHASVVIDGVTGYCHRILSANSGWTEDGVTWNHRYGTTAWAGEATRAGCTVPGTDYAATAMGSWSVTAADADGYDYNVSLDLTEFRSMISGNYGLVINSSNPYVTTRIYSSDVATTSERPSLVVVYEESNVPTVVATTTIPVVVVDWCSP
jgi:hypothetical protein